MIDTIVKRRTTLNGKTYQKGDTAPTPLQQFEDLKPTGRFERAPAKRAKTKPASRKKPVAKTSEPKVAPAASAPAPSPSDTFKSGDTAD